MAEERQQSKVGWGILGIIFFIIFALIGVVIGMFIMTGFSLDGLANFDESDLGQRLLSTVFELLFGISGSLLILHFLKKRPTPNSGMDNILDQEF